MAERQPGIDAGGGLADEAGAQHQLVADDLGVGGRLLGDGQEIIGSGAWRALYGWVLRATQQWRRRGPRLLPTGNSCGAKLATACQSSDDKVGTGA